MRVFRLTTFAFTFLISNIGMMLSMFITDFNDPNARLFGALFFMMGAIISLIAILKDKK